MKFDDLYESLMISNEGIGKGKNIISRFAGLFKKKPSTVVRPDVIPDPTKIIKSPIQHRAVMPTKPLPKDNIIDLPIPGSDKDLRAGPWFDKLKADDVARDRLRRMKPNPFAMNKDQVENHARLINLQKQGKLSNLQNQQLKSLDTKRAYTRDYEIWIRGGAKGDFLGRVPEHMKPHIPHVPFGGKSPDPQKVIKFPDQPK